MSMPKSINSIVRRQECVWARGTRKAQPDNRRGHGIVGSHGVDIAYKRLLSS